MRAKRTVIAFGLCCIFATALYLRIAYIMSDDFYLETAINQSSYTLTIPGSRGMIYDCNLAPLTRQTTTYQAAVLVTETNFDTILQHAEGITRETLLEQMHSGKPFICTLNTYQISDPNCHLFPVSVREESSGTVRHILGYCKDHHGVSGIEQACDDLLSPKTESSITYQLNGIGQGFTDRDPEITYGSDGTQGIVLTLDSEIQSLCERIGRKNLQKGAIVVMECATGKLKALCSFPEYDLSNLENAINDQENTPFLNRALSPYNVGSTFKVVTAAAALSGGYSPDTSYTCTGYYDLNGTKFHCHDRSGHGLLQLKDALMASCNPYFIQAGLTVTPADFLRTASDFSFGKPFELAPNLYTQSGKLPTSELLAEEGQLANFSFGQGYLTATPIQLAQMFSSVANDGFTPNPILLEGTTTDGKAIVSSVQRKGVQAVSPTIAELLKEYLTACVMEKEEQRSTPKTTTAAGKTATAQTGIYDKNGVELCNGWFGGFFPAENPVYAVVVLAEQAGEGSLAAAPSFRQIVDGISLLKGMA